MMKSNKKYSLIVIGASAGGMRALNGIFSKLPKKFCMPIVVVLHIGNNPMEPLINYFKENSNIPVKEAEDKGIVKKGYIYIAPPNYHLLVDECYSIMLSDDKKVNFSRPSIDVLFKSAAISFRESVIGIILTGANNDGALGLKYIKQFGGYTIVQNPNEASLKTMPQAAIDEVKVDRIVSLDEIGTILSELDSRTK